VLQTYIGDILLAVNPYKTLNVYDVEVCSQRFRNCLPVKEKILQMYSSCSWIWCVWIYMTNCDIVFCDGTRIIVVTRVTVYTLVINHSYYQMVKD